MALIKCRECGKEISDKTNTCPNCGYKCKNNNSKIIIIVLSAIIVILLFVIFMFYIKDELDDKNEHSYNYDNDIEDNENVENDKIPDIGENNNYISSNDALDIALKDLKISKSDIYDFSSELEYKFGKTVYDIDFNYNRFEYEYYIDAKTGEIVKSFREWD